MHEQISIHAPRVGRDGAQDGRRHPRLISIHAPRVGRDLGVWLVVRHSAISIHAPRVGRDYSALPSSLNRLDFNPRAPCGARHSSRSLRSSKRLFQSTRPVWGATHRDGKTERHARDFNPRAPCGARLKFANGFTIQWDFNPRAPCGARHEPVVPGKKVCAFQSTRPVWGATSRVRPSRFTRRISIHAPRVGRDIMCINSLA